MKEHELVWAMLPEGLEPYFEIQGFEKNEGRFRIILVEKNTVPKKLTAEYQGKKIINSVLNEFLLDDFPIQGRKGEILLKRRSWKFEGVEKMLSRDLDLCFEGTKLSKEFAVFLKELDRS